MKTYYLVCEPCGARIRISKRLAEWLEAHRGDLGIVVEAYKKGQGIRGLKPDTKVLRFSIEVEEKWTLQETAEKLKHNQV